MLPAHFSMVEPFAAHFGAAADTVAATKAAPANPSMPMVFLSMQCSFVGVGVPGRSTVVAGRR